MKFSLGYVLSLLLVASEACAEPLADLPLASIDNEAATTVAMRTLAVQLLQTYRNEDRDTDLDNRFRLQLVAGRYAQAAGTLTALRAVRGSDPLAAGYGTVLRYQIYASTKKDELAGRLAFDKAFERAFRELFRSLDDVAASQAIAAFGSPLDPYGVQVPALQSALAKALDVRRGNPRVGSADALDLVRKYLDAHSLAAMQPLSGPLIAEDDRRRYQVQDDVLVKTPDGASIDTMVVRPRSKTATRLPTLLNFTIYANPVWAWSELRLTAAHGYVAVVAYTRGKGRSPDVPVPYEHDGTDAAAVIDWIAAQPWSDGRVGMYGGSYSGFTQWAAAKHLPSALKAIMPSVTVAPGIDVPMEGNVFLNFLYKWAPYVASGKGLDQGRYDDAVHWEGVDRSWYVGGTAYRDLDRIDGAPNPIFRRWLDHPDYDAYWQAMIPYQSEFAAIDIPVLTTTGYYDGGQIGALYYFDQHHRYYPRADHYLLIGPYNHLGAQRSAWNTLRGYDIDPVARIDIGKVLRYQWFDYLFRGAPKPALLKDRVNFEVMGANVWKHAPSLEAMGNGTLHLHLDAARIGPDHRLSETLPSADSTISQQIDFADRSDVDMRTSGLILDKQLDRRNSLVFVSDLLREPTEVSGLFSGQLDFVVDKRDLDISMALYEQLSDGRYFQLSWYTARASYIGDRSHRALLAPGKREQLAFRNGRLTSRLLQPGSRLVLVLGVVKQPDTQINYGTGRDVSDETIADAKKPLHIEWHRDSFIDIPIWRPTPCTDCTASSVPVR